MADPRDVSHTLTTLAKAIRIETGKVISRANVHLVLKNRFYIGFFQWAGQTYPGCHPLFVNPQTFAEVQSVLTGHNRPKYSKQDIAFRGLMTCAYDNCMVTGMRLWTRQRTLSGELATDLLLRGVR